jgi:hypothetical protein
MGSNVPMQTSKIRKQSMDDVELKECPAFVRVVKNDDLNLAEKRHVKYCPLCQSVRALIDSTENRTGKTLNV